MTPAEVPAVATPELLAAWDREVVVVAVDLMRERARPASDFECWGWSDIVTYAKENWP